MKYFTSHFSVAGPVRSVNEDSLCYRQTFFAGKEILLAVICDGMGGMDKGEVASASVVAAFYEWFEKRMPEMFRYGGFDEDYVINDWRRLIGRLNMSLADYGNNQNIKLGTTVSAILIYGDGHYVISHVGDSRIYHIGTKIKQLTQDQSLVADEVRQGKLSRRKAAKDSRNNILLECIGISQKVNPFFQKGKVRYGAILLCTDGFWHKCRWYQYYSLLLATNANKEVLLQKIIKSHEKLGETDNMSAIVIGIGG